MERAGESGLEVEPSTSPEVVPQPDGNKYYLGGGALDYPIFGQPDQSHQSQEKSQGRFRGIWVLAIIAVVCLAVAVGAGLSKGLAAQHRPSSSSDAPSTITSISGFPSTGIKTSNAPVIIVQGSEAPVTITHSGRVATTTPTVATFASPVCPAANGSTYVATNKPLPTISGWQIPNTSLSFEILCNTNFVSPVSGSTDLQIFTNVSSLSDCLDKCALYSFQTKASNFPTTGCTGIALGQSASPLNTCWLKGNVTLETVNVTAWWPDFDAAVLLNV